MRLLNSLLVSTNLLIGQLNLSIELHNLRQQPEPTSTGNSANYSIIWSE